MRIRKKKNLDSRLAECDNLISINDGDKDFRNTEGERFDFETMFSNSNPVHIEIGCGKGTFVCKTAAQNSDINFVAIEKCANVIVQACEQAKRENLKNIVFVKMDAEYLLRTIPENSAERIYLNFSCPFPKKAHISHRLTNIHFLQMYKKILKSGAEIWQKTDNMHFFEYSIGEFSKAEMLISEVSLDLHNSDFEGNIETEYEHKFASQGMPIYRLVATNK